MFGHGILQGDDDSLLNSHQDNSKIKTEAKNRGSDTNLSGSENSDMNHRKKLALFGGFHKGKLELRTRVTL